MPRSRAKTRRKILDAAYALFRQRGYSRVTMDDISERAKLTKRTLYNHFESKDQLLADVLEAQHELALQAFRTFGDGLSGSAQSIVEAMFLDLSNWTKSPRWAGSGFTRFVIELADLPGHPARSIARRHKAQLEACLSDLLAEAGASEPAALARSIWLLTEGAMVLILIHGNRGYAEAASETAVALARLHTK
jgi:AcrR family transcriptional regulator